MLVCLHVKAPGEIRRALSFGYCHAERSEASYHCSTSRFNVARCFTTFSVTDDF